MGAKILVRLQKSRPLPHLGAASWKSFPAIARAFFSDALYLLSRSVWIVLHDIQCFFPNTFRMILCHFGLYPLFPARSQIIFNPSK